MGTAVTEYSDIPEGFTVQSFSDIPEGFTIAEPTEEKPARSLSERVLRGLKLGGRYLAETPGLTVAGLSDALASGLNVGLDAWSPAGKSPYQLPTNRAQTVSEGFDRMGFPQPENTAEQYGERISRALVGAGFGPAVGGRMAASPNPVTANVGRVLQEQPGIQAAGAITGAASGEFAEQAGAGPAGQFAAEVIGGGLAPAATVGGARTVMGAGRAIAGAKDALTKTGQRKIAGNILDDAAVNSQRAAKNIDDAEAFGSLTEPTTGQASRDPGLLTLERAARALDSRGRFSMRNSQANAQRQRILDVIGGEDVAALKEARNATTGAQRDAAFANADTVNVAPIQQRIDTILGSPEGKRRVVRQALEAFRKEFDGVDDVRVLYEVRKDINDAMQGKFRNQERSDFQLAKSQLKAVKNAIDDEIERVAPGFKKYLEDYARLSREIEQQEVIQGIQERATLAASDPASGRDVLSQAKFKRMVNAERKNGTLTDEQLTVLDAIAADLDSGQSINSSTVRPPGSDTAKNLTVAHIIGRAMGGNADSPFVTTLFRPFRWVTQLSEDQVQGLVVDAMLDPRLARMLLAEARPDQVKRASAALRTLAGAGEAGAALGAQTPDPDRKQQPEQ